MINYSGYQNLKTISEQQYGMTMDEIHFISLLEGYYPINELYAVSSQREAETRFESFVQQMYEGYMDSDISADEYLSPMYWDYDGFQNMCLRGEDFDAVKWHECIDKAGADVISDFYLAEDCRYSRFKGVFDSAEDQKTIEDFIRSSKMSGAAERAVVSIAAYLRSEFDLSPDEIISDLMNLSDIHMAYANDSDTGMHGVQANVNLISRAVIFSVDGEEIGRDRFDTLEDLIDAYLYPPDFGAFIDRAEVLWDGIRNHDQMDKRADAAVLDEDLDM